MKIDSYFVRLRALRVFVLLSFSFGVLSLVTGCARPEPTIVVTVGGLGFSQMHDLRMAVKEQCPEAKVVSAGAWDAYKSDIKGIVNEKPRQHVILIGHSFGCEAIDKAADELPKVDLAIFIDPAWDDFELSNRIEKYIWFKRSNFDLIRQAMIGGATKARVIKGGHNEIPHSEQLITEVVAAIKNVDGGGGNRKLEVGSGKGRGVAESRGAEGRVVARGKNGEW